MKLPVIRWADGLVLIPLSPRGPLISIPEHRAGHFIPGAAAWLAGAAPGERREFEVANELPLVLGDLDDARLFRPARPGGNLQKYFTPEARRAGNSWKSKRWQDAQRAKGLCIYCHAPPWRGNRCRKHWLQHRKWDRKTWHKLNPGGRPRKGPPRIREGGKLMVPDFLQKKGKGR